RALEGRGPYGIPPRHPQLFSRSPAWKRGTHQSPASARTCYAGRVALFRRTIAMRTTPFVLLCSLLLFAGHFAVAASAQEPAADPDAATTPAPTAQPQDPAPADAP